ncbi:MAG: NACHT domain-containing protein, partial [Candidatus Marithrix sp.]|nr:NACHT domain-containing protein [Candidatus Marithrix sp.]
MSLITRFFKKKPNPEEDFWQELLRYLEWSEGFCLIFLFASNSPNSLRQRLDNRFNLQVIKIDSTENIPNTIFQFEELTKVVTNAPIWIELDQNITNISPLFSRLNERRELLRNNLQRPLIFVLPSGYRQQLRELSPDLWAIRDYSFNLDDLIKKSNIMETFLLTIQTIISNPLFQGTLAVLAMLFYFQDKFKSSDISEPKKTSWFSNFQSEYNKHVIYEHRMFNVKGLRVQGAFTLKLEKVFVELRISHSNPQKINVNPVFAKEFVDNHPIWDFLQFKADDTLVLGIIGAPGCGKTTLLQHIALIFASKQHRKYKMKAQIPVLLFLRQHVEKIGKKVSLADLAQEHFAAKNLEPPAGWFAKQLNIGKCLVLLDGLDEVADLEQRKQVSEWVDEQVVKYPRCKFVVTSRPQGYLTAPVERANVLEVQPFNSEQVKKFIHAWYLANEVTSFGHRVDDGIRQRARDAADDLIMRLRSLPALSDLTVNPLLLTMIAMVHRYRGQLPGRRVELYAEICDVLLGHWRQARGVEVNLTAAQKRVALQPLAGYMMQNQKREIRLEEI